LLLPAGPSGPPPALSARGDARPLFVGVLSRAAVASLLLCAVGDVSRGRSRAAIASLLPCAAGTVSVALLLSCCCGSAEQGRCLGLHVLRRLLADAETLADAFVVLPGVVCCCCCCSWPGGCTSLQISTSSVSMSAAASAAPRLSPATGCIVAGPTGASFGVQPLVSRFSSSKSFAALLGEASCTGQTALPGCDAPREQSTTPPKLHICMTY
jgi:hypothetical protein